VFQTGFHFLLYISGYIHSGKIWKNLFAKRDISKMMQDTTISKVLERLVLIQLRPHLLNSANFSEYQSGYRAGHSTETALLEILGGIYTAADN
jgi:retron-type reverse transcriptase